MSRPDANPYSPPLEPGTDLPSGDVDNKPKRRPPYVSALLGLALLLLTSLPLAGRNDGVAPGLAYVVAWTAVFSVWASTIVYRVHALSMPKPRSSRGIAMLSACAAVFILGLVMKIVGRPPGVFVLPFGVVIAIIVSCVRGQSRSTGGASRLK